jgi:hypothetical protein
MDKIFLKLGGNPVLYMSSRYFAIAYWLDPVRSFNVPMASFTICQAARNPKETMIRTLSDTSQQPKTKPKRRKRKIPVASMHL